MHMSFSPSVLIFFMSLGLGAIFGALWDIFRILRLGIPLGRMFIFLQDIIYFAIICILTLIFFYFFTFGGFRLFVLLGEFLGFLIYYLTIGHVVFAVFKIIIRFIHKFVWGLTWPVRKLLLKITHIFQKFLQSFKRKIKKYFQIKKKFLHFKGISVYNKMRSKSDK